ncbi:hypothetical protein OS493_014091 [Desmophyllum pertusum]|uniref:Carbohydrate kinase PfkB domain-containing protein n=1 Tax=Desmophyllum pertusum TaxID=174260 RepID=A0A9W9ZDP7_9CNID|nr:hypothetical protein OS493_014091 [Desmophyllum pertusum]
MISYVPHFPQIDETVKGTKFQLDFGGKAANQCVMAQKLGANTAMIAKIGSDQFGKDTVLNFKRLGGIPVKIATEALQYGKKLGSRTLFNPSPELESIPDADVLVLNREEGESLTAISATDFKGAKKVIVNLHQQGTSHVVLTLGSEGAISSEMTSEHKTPVMTHIRTSKVDVVDTTGAGDALIGALAFYMSCYPQLSFAEMVSRAVNIATVTVTVHGVQSSYPTRDELDKWLFDIDAKTSEQLGLDC